MLKEKEDKYKNEEYLRERNENYAACWNKVCGLVIKIRFKLLIIH